MEKLYKYINGVRQERTVVKETPSFVWVEGGLVNGRTKLDKRLLTQWRG